MGVSAAPAESVNVAAARRALAEHADIGAVVADFRLPGSDNGLDFLLSLRTSAPHIHGLLVTGETAPDRIALIRASGVTCLFKPVPPERLVEALAAQGG